MICCVVNLALLFSFLLWGKWCFRVKKNKKEGGGKEGKTYEMIWEFIIPLSLSFSFADLKEIGKWLTEKNIHHTTHITSCSKMDDSSLLPIIKEKYSFLLSPLSFFSLSFPSTSTLMSMNRFQQHLHSPQTWISNYTERYCNILFFFFFFFMSMSHCWWKLGWDDNTTEWLPLPDWRWLCDKDRLILLC